jgi:hypothetical protein
MGILARRASGRWAGGSRQATENPLTVKYRERRRDLHDELGSNGVALISSFSGMEDGEPEQMRSDLLTG